jgi:hypothetical protein
LIVAGAIMIEPTETESKQELDAFYRRDAGDCREVQEQPELVKTAPHTTRLGRMTKPPQPEARPPLEARGLINYCCPSIQTLPVFKNSFFQIGTIFFSLSIA